MAYFDEEEKRVISDGEDDFNDVFGHALFPSFRGLNISRG